jgi:zinc protease
MGVLGMGRSRAGRWLMLLLLSMSLAALPPGRLEGKSLPAVDRHVLSNNLVLLVSEEHSLPFVIFEMLIDAGSRRDPPGAEGLAHHTARAVLLGTARLSNTELNEGLDFLGASLSSSAGRDFCVLRLQVLKKDMEKGLDLLMQVLGSPAFPEEELQKLKQRTLGAIRAEDEQPLALADRIFQKTLFPASPYGHPVEGTPDSVSRLSREDVLRFFRTFYRPNNTIMAIVGDITVGEVQERIVPLLVGLEKGDIPDPSPDRGYATGPKEERIDRKIAQASIVIGNAGPKRGDPDYYAAVVMNYILGGGSLQSRLMEEIRVKRGLAYSIMSHLSPYKYQGSFQIFLQTRNASAAEAIWLVKQQMEAMRTAPVSDESLRRAKRYLIGNFPLRMDTQSKLAGILTRIEYYGLGLEYLERYDSFIESVTKEDVLRASRNYLHPDRAITVIVGDTE